MELREIGDDAFLTRHFFLHKLVEMVDGYVFKATILTLGQEPIIHLFKCVLLPLLIRKIESVAGLLVEGSQRVCRVDEAVFQGIEVDFACHVANEKGGVHLHLLLLIISLCLMLKLHWLVAPCHLLNRSLGLLHIHLKLLSVNFFGGEALVVLNDWTTSFMSNVK